MEPGVIFEDDSLIILDKPTGWIVNEVATSGETPVIQTWLKENFDYPASQSEEERSGVVHRLDKETSGVLIIAKTKDAFKNLQSQFKKRKIEKTYLALVHGKLEPEEETVKAPVGRLPWNRERFGVIPGGRKSETSYKVKDYYRKGKNYYSLVEFYPKTGRTHQIRIHAKYLGHPLVSDSFYAGRKRSRADRKWCPRLFLHATKISFTHPKKGEKVEFTSHLPKDLQQCLNSLR